MNTRTLAATGGFLGTILAANYVTTRYGMIPVGFGLTATAGTYLAGASFVLRDAVQDTIRSSMTTETRGRGLFSGIIAVSKPYNWQVALRVAAVIAVGAVLSLVLALTLFRANPLFLPHGVTAVSIALASGAAFLISETADLTVYTPLRQRGYIRAAVASNIVGAIVDTYVFLTISGFGLTVWQGQLVGKLTITLAVVVAVALIRARRQAVTA